MVRSETAGCQGNAELGLHSPNLALGQSGTEVLLTALFVRSYSARGPEEPWPGAGEAGVYCLDTRRRIPLRYRRSHFHTFFALEFTQPEEVNEPLDSGGSTGSSGARECNRGAQPRHDGERGHIANDDGEWWRTTASPAVAEWWRTAASPAMAKWWRPTAPTALEPVTLTRVYWARAPRFRECLVQSITSFGC